MTVSLELQADGRLVHTYWDKEPAAESGQYRTRDVTGSALEWLFDSVALAPDVTVRSVFLLLQQCPALVGVFRRSFSEELLREAMASEVPADPESGLDMQDIEYACLYRHLGRNSGEKTMEGVSSIGFHGVGFVAREDILEHGHVVCRAGSRIHYGFSLTGVRHLLELPLRLDTELTVSEEDSSIERFWEKRETWTCAEYKLGEVLHGMLWELSWHGPQEDREAFAQELKGRVASIEDGSATLVPLDDVLDRLRPKSRGDSV